MIRYTAACRTATNGQWLSGEPARRRRSAGGQSIRVFENPVLEWSSRAHVVTPGVWFGPFVVYAMVTAPARVGGARATLLFAAGALLFSLFEYALHRVVFHGLMRRAVTDERWRFAAFMAHGYHHEFPNDGSRLVMPPMISWPLAALFFGVYRLLLGPALYAPMLAGTMVGYLAYDWIHYYTHHARPRTLAGKWMRAYHLRHHYQDPNAHYGISSPLWDWVFRTHRSGGADRHVVRR